eukprot:symbB.v1.2.031186.t2/scaffold3591.1/size53548/3
MAKRVDHYGRAEGHCIVISETPVKSKTTANGRDFYAEIKMETDSDSWSSGMDMGLTLLSPDVVGQANEQGLCWAEFPDTWVFRGDGMLRINGRAYPPGAMPGQCAMMQGWNTAALEWGDTCGLQIRKGGSEIVGYRNGEEIGCLELDEVIQVPTDQELYLICDVIGRAGEVEILDVNVPAAEPEAPAEVEVPAVVPAAPKVEVAAAVNPSPERERVYDSPGQSQETFFCAAAGDELAAYERPRDALEAMSPRWRLGGGKRSESPVRCRRSTAVSFQLIAKRDEVWHFACQDISDAQRWFDFFTGSSADPSASSTGRGTPLEGEVPEVPRDITEAALPSSIPEEPSSDDETTATSSPRESRVETLAQLELTLARHVNRFEQAFRLAEEDCRELLRFFGLEDSRFGASSLLESLNDFCGQLRSAWDDLEKAQQKSSRLQTPRKTPRKTPRSASMATNSAMKDDDAIQQWQRIWSLHSTNPTE